MTPEDGGILALLSEPSLSEEELNVSGSDDILPAILEAIKSNENASELSPEEAAWADSCFVHTSELSDDDWRAMRGALLDDLEKPTESPNETSESMGDQGIPTISEAKLHSLHSEKVSLHDDVHMEQRDYSHDNGSTEACEVADVIRVAHEHDSKMDHHTVKHEDGDELTSPEVPEETDWRDSIFKVWDLELSLSDDDGELELVKDLKKLLKSKDSLPQALYPPSDDTAEPLSEINIDELVAGLSDLSIRQTNE